VPLAARDPVGERRRARGRRGRLGLAAILSLVVVFAVLAQGSGWNQNSHYALTRALSQGTPVIGPQQPGAWYSTGDVSYFEGHVYSNKAPGFAFVSLPAFLVLKAAGQASATVHASAQLWFLGLWSVVLPALVLLLLVRKIAEELQPGYGTATAVTLGLATLVLPFSTLFFSHVLSALLGFAAFAVLWEERRGAPRVWRVAAAGALAGYAITTEFSCGITACVLGCYALARPGALRRAIAFATGAFVGIVPLLAYDQWAFGSPFHLSYQSTVGFGPTGTLFLGAPSFRRAVELLFATSGLLRTAPVLALGAAGTVLLYRRGVRLEALVVSAIAVGFLVFNASFGGGFGGSTPGPRYMIPMLPFLAVPLALAYRRFPLTTLFLGAVSAVEMTAVTVTHPLKGSDGRWFQRIGDGDFSSTVFGFFGRLSSAHWSLLVLAPIVLALAFVAAERPRLRPSWPEGMTAAACLLGWLVVQREAPRFLNGHGVARDWAPLVVVLLVAAVVVFALLLPALFRAPPGPLREGESPSA
jgi:hypothetical protein